MNIEEEIKKNQQIRNNILKILYIYAEKNPSGYIEKSRLEAETKIDGNKLDQEVLFLKEYNQLKIITSYTTSFQAAQITSEGRKYIENLPKNKLDL